MHICIAATHTACFPVMYWRTLEEIDAGVYDGLTYEEIKETAEQEYSRRQKNKYWYRYPHGESYHDLVARLEPVIMELERSKKPLLIVSHQAVLRVIYAYLADEKPERCTNLSMPLHTVVKVHCFEPLLPPPPPSSTHLSTSLSADDPHIRWCPQRRKIPDSRNRPGNCKRWDPWKRMNFLNNSHTISHTQCYRRMSSQRRSRRSVTQQQ